MATSAERHLRRLGYTKAKIEQSGPDAPDWRSIQASEIREADADGVRVAAHVGGRRAQRRRRSEASRRGRGRSRIRAEMGFGCVKREPTPQLEECGNWTDTSGGRGGATHLPPRLVMFRGWRVLSAKESEGERSHDRPTRRSVEQTLAP